MLRIVEHDAVGLAWLNGKCTGIAARTSEKSKFVSGLWGFGFDDSLIPATSDTHSTCANSHNPTTTHPSRKNGRRPSRCYLQAQKVRRRYAYPTTPSQSPGLLRTRLRLSNCQWHEERNILRRIADGVFYAELNEFFQRELAEEGYSGVEVRVTPTVTDIIIRATHTQEVLGEQGRRIRELTSLIQKRFKFPENSVSLYAAKVQNRGLSAVAQCESLRYKLLNGLAVRRACYGVLRFIMESGAKGCEVVVSGKLRAARAKSMKFTVWQYLKRRTVEAMLM